MKLSKLYKKKECYRLTGFSRLAILFLLLIIIRFAINSLYGFLSPNKTTETKILVVEGWIGDFEIQEG